MLSRLSVKKPYTVIVGIILVLVLGYISFQHMTTDLLPSMNLPYVVVYTAYPGATPEQVESGLTRPMEASFATLTDIKKITSQSRDNVSVVIMQFNDGANMDTALIEISSKLDQLQDIWPDDAGAPVSLKLNPDMLPVAILSVSRDDMDIVELSDYVNDELVPAFEALNGVASATASGVIEQEIDVTIEQALIDVVNSAILQDIDAELAKVEKELNDAQAQLSDGRRQLARAKSQAYGKINDALKAIEDGEAQIDPAIAQLTGQRDALAAQREDLAAGVESMERVMAMSEEEAAGVQQAAAALGALRAQRDELAALLTALEDPENSELIARRREAQAQRDALADERDGLETYVADLSGTSAEDINGDIDRLQADIAGIQGSLAQSRSDLDALEARRESLRAGIDALTARIDALEADAGDGGDGADDGADGDDNNGGGSDGGDGSDNGGDNGGNGSGDPDDGGDGGDNGGDNGGDDSGDDNGGNSGGDNGGNSGDNGSGDPDGGGDDSGDGGDNGADGGGNSGGDNGDGTDGSGSDNGGNNGDNGSGDPDGGGDDSGDGGDNGADGGGNSGGDNGDGTDGSGSDNGGNNGDNGSGDPDGGGDNGSGNADNGDGAGDGSGSSSGSEDNSGSADNSDSGSSASSGNSDSGNSDSGSSGGSGGADSGSSGSSGGSGGADSGSSSGSGGADSGSSGSSDSGKSGSSHSGSDKPDAGKSDADAPKPAAPEGGEALAALRGLGSARADEPDVDQLKAERAALEAELAEVDAAIDAKSDEIDALNGQLASVSRTLIAKQNALDVLEDENADVAASVATAEAQIEALDQDIEALDQAIAAIDGQLAAAGGSAAELAQQLAALDMQIQALEASGAEQAAAMLSDPDALDAQYAQAKAGLEEMDAGLAQLDGMIDKLGQGIIPGGFIEGIDEDTKLSDAKDQIEAAQAQAASAFAEAEDKLNEGAAELAKARKEFNEKRDEAFEDAGLDGVITVQTVSGIIGAQNFSMPAGYVDDADEDPVLVRVGDKFASMEAIRQMKLFNLGLDTVDEVRLADVAAVALVDDRDDVFTKLDGHDGILLSMDKQSTYSTADVADTIMARAAELQAQEPNLHIVDLMNQGEYIDIVVDSVLNNLLYGGALAILVLLLFLLDWRPTLTVAFSIPISVIAAFVCMYFSGITLNVLSLSGLSLGIGMLVDNSIVAIENIYRLHDEEGLPLLRACVEGVRTVSGALFSSTMTTICVFLPIVFVQGMARDLFADMGLTIAFSLLASLVVAMTVVPMMSSFLMRRSRPRKHRLFSGFQRLYAALLRGALRVKPLVLLAAVALLAYSGMQVSKMGISFMPEVNSRQMSASLTPDAAMSLNDQRAQAMAVMEDMLAIEGIGSIGLMDGSSGLLSSSGDFSYYIIVDEAAGRKNADIAAEIEAVGAKHGAALSAQASTMDISMLTGSGISVEITGDDLETLQAIARDVADIARLTGGVTDVDDGLEDAVPELRIVVDRERAVDEGLTTAQVYQFIAQKLMDKVEIGQVTLDGKELSIQLIEGRNLGLRPEDIQDLEIEVDTENENKLVRIGDISEVRDTTSLSTISRASQRRMVTVSFAVADGYSANLVSDDFEARLAEYQPPAGYSIDLAGENETVMGIMEDLVWMIMIAVLLIFLIMVAQFQSFKSPIIVMFTIPLAFTGGLLALLLTRMDLSIVSMLGFLVLSGVVVNNGIVFIDCVNQLRIAGMEKRAALIEAGRQRLRPILMTAMTTILGMSTMALGHGTGAEMMQPMAVVAIGGLAYATLMTLFVVPVLYDLFNGRQMKAREIQMIREAAGMNGDGLPDAGAPAPDAAPAAGAAPAVGAVSATEPAPETGAAPGGVPPVPVFAAPRAAAEAKPIRVQLGRAKKRRG